jgi:hypothetical protein
MITVTAPGVEVLPWSHDGRRVVERSAAQDWNNTAPRRWSELHRRAQQAVKRAGWSLNLLAYGWELQGRGVLHLHLVVGFGTEYERRSAWEYVRALRARTRSHGFGNIDARDRDGKAGKATVFEKHRAAGYLSKYLGKSAQLLEAIGLGRRERPARLFWISPRLTRVTGCIRRRLRRARFLWHIRAGTSIFARAGRLPAWFHDAGELAAVQGLLRGVVPAGP